MRFAHKINMDHFFLLALVLLMLGLPFAIKSYDRTLAPQNLPPGTKSFTLVGNAQEGWLLGDVQAHDVLSLRKKAREKMEPVIRVSLGDVVSLKLRSSDVTHGFSLKAFGIYLAEGIQPGKTVYVYFKADKVGTFVFMCNVFCGDIHRHMQGRLIVR